MPAPKRKPKLYVDSDCGVLVADMAAWMAFKRNIAPVANIRMRPGQNEPVPFTGVLMAEGEPPHMPESPDDVPDAVT